MTKKMPNKMTDETPNHPCVTKPYFESLKDFIFSKLQSDEYVTLNLRGESTHFCRMNNAKIRQNGTVMDQSLSIQLQKNKAGELRTATEDFSLSKNFDQDSDQTASALRTLRSEIETLPADPFTSLPESTSTSESVESGTLLNPSDAPEKILSKHTDLDLTGIYSSGSMVRGTATSTGAMHWFSTDSFLLDYSISGAEERAYKGFYGGSSWDTDEYEKEIQKAQEQLNALKKPVRKIPPGNYRTYLAPTAAWAFSQTLARTFSEGSIRQGSSPLRLVRRGEKSFSPKLTLLEDFQYGDTPRFTSEGELSPENTPLIVDGKLKNTLISRRTAKEYGLEANGASSNEEVRSFVISPGNLAEEKVLDQLHTGLYISNLHYLNWSDQNQGRVTGMTRFACFWVENGKLVAPIENLRWDDTIFRCFGSELEDFTQKVHVFPNTGSYGNRSVGSDRCPGMLLKSMAFTL